MMGEFILEDQTNIHLQDKKDNINRHPTLIIHQQSLELSQPRLTQFP